MANLNLYLPKETRAQLEELTARNGESKAGIIARLIAAAYNAPASPCPICGRGDGEEQPEGEGGAQ